MKSKYTLIGILFLSSLSQAAMTQETFEFDGKHEKCREGHCPIPTKPICFNILCNYKKKNKDHHGFETCRSAAKFIKRVGEDGRETLDFSSQSDHPEFEVECDHQLIFNNSADRLTDHYGTRIQGAPGPFPATLLPRDALREGHHYVVSTLELENQVLSGYCYIYNILF
jgi:hypothetical protein